MSDSVKSNCTNTTTTEDDNKSLVHVDLLALFYIVGISGCFLALLHLHTRKTFRNTKQAFMLKWVDCVDNVKIWVLQWTVYSED